MKPLPPALALCISLAYQSAALPCVAQPSAASAYSEIALEHTRPAGADIFAVDSDATVWHLWQADKSGSWSGAEQLGGIAKDIAALARDDGRFEVFVVGSDDAIWHNIQQKSGWSGWQSLGGSAKRVAVAKTKAGRVGLFIVGADDAVWQSARNTPRDAWSVWQSLGGNAKQLAAATDERGGFRIFTIGSDDAIWHSGNQLADWQSLGGVGKDIAVTRGATGKLDVFHVGTDAAIWHLRQMGRGPTFGNWQSLGGNAAQCAINTNSAKRATLVTLAPDGHTLAYAKPRLGKSAAASGWSDWHADASALLDSSFTGEVTVEIPELHVSETRTLEVSLHFEPASSQVTISNFPALVTKRFHTPFGESSCTVTLIGGGTGRYDRNAGQVVIPVTLKFDQSLDVPAVQEDTQLEFELRSDGEGGAPIDRASGHVALAGSGAFRGKGPINPLKGKRCQMRIDGRVSPLP